MRSRPSLLWAALLALAAAASAAAAEAPMTTSSATYETPAGWQQRRSESGPDSTVKLVHGFAVLKVALYGGKGSRYAGERAYLAGPGRDYGSPPREAGSAVVAGKRRAVYEHHYPVRLGDPHASGAPHERARELFCLVPAGGGRFYVLSYAWEGAVEDLSGEGEAAWKKLLGTFTPPKAGPRR